MSEVLVRYGEDAQKTATLLLGAADKLEMEPYVVRHQPDDGGFRVPEEVAKESGLETADTDAEAEAAEEERRQQIDVINSERGVDTEGKPVDGEKKLTPKQKAVQRAEELGLDTSGTQKDIEKRIKQHESK